MNDYKLCYVEDNFAYFTTQELADQWGDGWAKSYPLNCGEPYEPCQIDRKNGKSWSIEKLAFFAELDTPDERGASYSPEQINAGAAAWLVSSLWSRDPSVVISSGVSIEQFTALVHQAGGEVFRRVEKRS